MAWIRVDDQYDEHPKFFKAGPVPTALWLRCLAYCNRNLTDGFIPRSAARERAWGADPLDPDGLIDTLVDVGLWEVVPGGPFDITENDRLGAPGIAGYQMHDYLDYQPSKAEVLAERARWADRKKRRRHRETPPGTPVGTPTVSLNPPVPVPVVTEPSSSLSPSLALETSTKLPPSASDAGRAGGNGASNGHDPDQITALEAFSVVFWPAYPRKIAKRRAEIAWKGLHLKDDDDDQLDRIMAALDKDIREEWRDRAMDKIPHPATWIHDRRWED